MITYITFEFEQLIIEHCMRDDLACRGKNRKNRAMSGGGERG